MIPFVILLGEINVQVVCSVSPFLFLNYLISVIMEQLLQQKLFLTPDPQKPFLLITINTGTHLQLDASATYALGVFDAGIDGLLICLFHLCKYLL